MPTYGQYDYNTHLFYDNISYTNPASIASLDGMNGSFYTYSYSGYRDSYCRMAVNMPLKRLNSGIGVHANCDPEYPSYFDLGLVYGHKFEIRQNFSVSVGTDISLIRKEFPTYIYNNGAFYFTDAIPIYLMDIDMGIWFEFHNIIAGIKVKNINSPSKENYIAGQAYIYSLEPYFTIFGNYNTSINEKHILRNSLMIDFLGLNANYFIQNHLVIKNTFIIGYTVQFDKSFYSLYPTIGFSLGKKFDFLLSTRAITTVTHAKIVIESFFNYKF